MTDTARFEHLLFVCTKERAADDPKGSCGQRGGAALVDRLKERVVAEGLKGRVRAVPSGCLDFCAKGCAVAAYSAADQGAVAGETWYTHLTPADADALFDSHIVGKEPLSTRLEQHNGKR